MPLASLEVKQQNRIFDTECTSHLVLEVLNVSKENGNENLLGTNNAWDGKMS